jgi:hypothetical protein
VSGRLGEISSYSESDSVAESLTAQKSDEQEQMHQVTQLATLIFGPLLRPISSRSDAEDLRLRSETGGSSTSDSDSIQ